MTAIRAIFFDIGDTLVFDDPPLMDRLLQAANSAGVGIDPVRLPAAMRAVERYALSVYDRVAADDPLVMRECAVKLLTEAGGVRLDDAALLNDPALTRLIDSFLSIPFRRYVHDGAVPLLTQLKQKGFLVGAISDWDEMLPDVLAELGLMPHLDTLSVSAIVGMTKPDPRLFHDALGKGGVAPGEALHVGDYLELDIVGARAAGMAAVLFDSKQRSAQADCPRFLTFAALSEYLLALPPPAAGSRGL